MFKIFIKEKIDLKKILFEAASQAGKVVTEKIYQEIKQDMKKEFLTLKELRHLDHPYAKRHFPTFSYQMLASYPKRHYLTRISRRKGGFDLVLQKEFLFQIERTDLKLGRIYFDLSKGPAYVTYVVKGTKKLIPRPLPYIYLLRNKSRLQSLLKRELLKQLKQRLI